MSELAQGLTIAAFSVILAAILAFIVRLNGRIDALAVSTAKLETQISPFWASVQLQISKDLHHPNPRYHEMDDLLEKLEALTISPEERERLKALLVERSSDTHEDISEDQRKKASLMIPLMDMVTEEAKQREVHEH
jgi:hypothetical protein